MKQIVLRMLESDSPDLTESGLLDWENLGRGIQLDDGEVKRLLGLTRNPRKPIALRLSILRIMSDQNLAGPEAWLYLIKSEDDENMLSVLNSVGGYENRDFMASLVSLLKSPSDSIAEGAARALGHPTYAGAETALGPLLKSERLRMNYAAVSALMGINSEQSRAILLDAAATHPEPKVRRMITARMNLITRL
jgi:hypothetical protein